MKINNSTLKQSAETEERITQRLSRFNNKCEGLTYQQALVRRPCILLMIVYVIGNVTKDVTGSVTEVVTGSVTPPVSIEEVVTSIEPNGCKKRKKQVVTASVTAVVTRIVTDKKKKTKKEEIPPAPPKEEKNKKIKTTHTNAHACEKKPKIVAKFAEKRKNSSFWGDDFPCLFV